MENFYYICAAVLFGVFGVCVGSFSNVVIYRLPREMSLAKPSSHCPTCDHALAWYDNIPLFSYLFLGGKCRYCRCPITPRYFFVELTTGLLWLCAFFLFYNVSPYLSALYCLAISAMICIGFIDEENMFIPDTLQIILFVVGGAVMFLDPSAKSNEHLIGMLIGAVFYLFFYGFSYVAYKKEGLGFGDVKLMAAIGLLLGWKKILITILLASVIAVVRLAMSDKNAILLDEKEYPLAPSLVMGAMIALLLGDPIIQLYSTFLLI